MLILHRLRDAIYAAELGRSIIPRITQSSGNSIDFCPVSEYYLSFRRIARRERKKKEGKNLGKVLQNAQEFQAGLENWILRQRTKNSRKNG